VQFSFERSSFDVTYRNTVASLAPLTLAIGFGSDTSAGLITSGTLRFWDRTLGKLLGTLTLSRAAFRMAGVNNIAFFEIEHGSHNCISWAHRHWDTFLRRRTTAKSRDPHNFAMSSDAIDQLMIFYICPRPVVLVSVVDTNQSNIFPMDLIGPLASHDFFSLALRSTSPSTAAMKRCRRVALASICASDKDVAYELGAHHKKMLFDWSVLPFGIKHSPNFALPIPATALRVRELEISDIQDIGSHTFFLGKTVSDSRLSNELQLFHTSGFHQHFQKRNGRAFQLA